MWWGIIVAIIGSLVGAYINNVFTWRIKGQIDAIDRLYIDVTKLDNNLYLNLETVENRKSGGINNIVPLNYRDLFSVILLNDEILDRKFSTKIKDLKNVWINLEINSENIDEIASTEVTTCVQGLLSELSQYRKEVSSSFYMIKELFSPIIKMVFNIFFVVWRSLAQILHNNSIS